MTRFHHGKKKILMNIFSLILFPCLFLIASCMKETKSSLEGCCGNPAIDEAVGNGHLYFPNIFTPDADGINDIIVPYGDNNIVLVLSMNIKDQNGDIVFSGTDIIPGNAIQGWDGRINGVKQIGMYDVTLVVKAGDGTIKTLQGRVCSYPCHDEDGSKIPGHPDCQFPTQTQDGHFDPTIPSGENEGCFE